MRAFAFAIGVTLGLIVGLLLAGLSHGGDGGGGVLVASGAQPLSVPLPNGKTLTVPPGHRVRVRLERPPGTPATHDLSETASASGIGVRTTAQQIDESLEFDSPEVAIPGARSKAGKAFFTAKMWSLHGINLLLVGGGLLAAGGIVVAIKFDRALGAAMVVGGLILAAVGVVAQQYPWALGIGLGAVVLVGAVFLYREYRKRQTAKALEDVAAGVESSPPEAATEVKRHIGAADSGGTRQEVRRVKAKLAREGRLTPAKG